MSYAIIRVGGKQYKVEEGERLLVDRLEAEAGKTFEPDLLFTPGGDGPTVTARVVEHVKGEKIRIGKYRRRTGYKRHTGFRASLTEIEIESIGKAAARPRPERKATAVAPEAPEKAAAEPEGYGDMTIAQIKEAVSGWSREQIEAALAYEQGHGKRKGAVAALESALKEASS